MSLNFILNKNNLSTDTFINMEQNRVLNLSLPTNTSDFISKKYLDEKLAIAANVGQINECSLEGFTIIFFKHYVIGFYG